MKRVFPLVCLIFIRFHLFAQDTCLKRANALVNVYYGYPYFGKSYLKSSYPYSPGPVITSNHLGISFEGIVSQRIGVGFEGTYATAIIKNVAGISKLRVLVKLNYHFVLRKKADTYLSAGIGYLNQSTYASNHPDNLNSNSFIEAQIPLALRLAVGFRYFISNRVGFNAEAGLGGPLVQAGFSIKFN